MHKEFSINEKIILLIWNLIRKLTFRIQPSAQYYYLKYQELLNQQNKKDAYELLISGADYYHKHYQLNINAALYCMEVKDWNSSLKYWERLYDHNLLKEEQEFIDYVTVLEKTKSQLDVIAILEENLKKYPFSSNITAAIFEKNIALMKWEKAINIYEYMERKELLISDSVLIKRAMLYQVFGDYENANAIYNEVFSEKEPVNEHTKIILFDNNESRIEFYKKHEIVNQVCLTFDSINIRRVHDPFGFKFLKKEKLDLIALRRRRKNSYHQDLLVDEYYEIVNQPVNFYDRKIAYGFSLGGYTSLYYGSSVDAEVLSISPRNSTHPIYGVGQDTKELFTHEIVQRKNDNITPIILYDPKNNLDKNYVEEELKDLYPNAKFVKCSYAGHRIAPYLLQIGALKDVVKSVIDNTEFPHLKSYDKRNSYQYLRILSEVCYVRGKYKLARDISKLGLEINEIDLRLIKVYISSLVRLSLEKEAYNWLNENIKSNSHNWLKHIHNLLDMKIDEKQLDVKEENIDRSISRTII